MKKYFILDKEGNSLWKNNPTGEVCKKSWCGYFSEISGDLILNTEEKAILLVNRETFIAARDTRRRIETENTLCIAIKLGIKDNFDYQEAQKISENLGLDPCKIIKILKETGKYFYKQRPRLSSKRLQKKRQLVLERDKEAICVYCRQEFNFEDLTLDHVLPFARGGSSDLDNLVLSCSPCNTRKRNEIWEF